MMCGRPLLSRGRAGLEKKRPSLERTFFFVQVLRPLRSNKGYDPTQYNKWIAMMRLMKLQDLKVKIIIKVKK